MSMLMAGALLPALLPLLIFSPWLVPFVLRRAGIFLGLVIANHTQFRRQALLAASRPSAKEAVDDWEKVEGIKAACKSGDRKSWDGIVGFFHPFCNAGGGGERVLWAAIKVTQQKWPEAICVVYTGDHEADKESILDRVQTRFNITLEPATLHFLYLSTRNWVLASSWPRFTLLGQSLGSIVLAFDAFNLLVPDLFIDTMGYAFALWLCKYLYPRVPTGAYVHYPTISTDMLDSLDSELEEHGLNAGAGKGAKGFIKKTYWRIFAGLYSRVGGSIDVVMTNSSWTQSHIQTLWGTHRHTRQKQREITVVFPPVAVEEVEQQVEVSATGEKKRRRVLLYIAQFRPEKNHTMILQAFAKLVASQVWSPTSDRPRLVLVGSVRNDDDAKRVYKLRLLVHELQIKNDVDFICDASWDQILQLLRTASIGVNGMWNEHFGIGVVEYQAAGLITVVNDSGGPKLDIVAKIDGQPTGYHASTVDQYADAFLKALQLDEQETIALRLRARKSAKRFTEAEFTERWIENMQALIEIELGKRPKR